MTGHHCFIFILLVVHVSANIAVHSNQLNKFVLKSSTKSIANPGICLREAKCEPILNATCFGTPLPYSHTSLALAEDSIFPLDIQDNLALWQGLRTVPRCWAVVQPLLCAVYMPKCENRTLSLPSQEMCRMTRGPCRAVEAKHGWPPFLRCENKKIFPPRCWNPLQEVKFNTSSKCVSPLVETDNPDSWYTDIEGCGLQCQNPYFTAEEHEKLHNYIKILASICVAINLFAVLTFLINCKYASCYPSGIIVCLNICLFFASCGWLLQFYPGHRAAIACLPDGTVRRHQPNFNGPWCVMTFVLIYSFTIASLVWFIILCYAWHASFQKCSSSKKVIGPKNSNFHLLAWSVALLMTVTAMATMQVDGNYASGICFVGYTSFSARLGFVLVPVAVAIFVGGLYLLRAIYTLLKLRKHELPDRSGKKKINSIICKLIIFCAACVVLVLCTIGCHVYESMYASEWESHLRKYLVCLATLSASSLSSVPHPPCTYEGRPNVLYMELHFMSFFGFSIVMSMWTFRLTTIELWRQFLSRFCEVSGKNLFAAKVRQLISKTSSSQNETNGAPKDGLSSNEEDPIGMSLGIAGVPGGVSLDRNSIASRDISAALPQILGHRSTLAGSGALSLKQYSSASDVSTRRISLDSFHQQNLDSLSLQISEQEYAHVLRHQRRKTRKERERFLRANRIAPWFPNNRRGSDTSLQSSVLASSVAAAAIGPPGGTVTKSTSTGDLIASAMFPPPSSYVVNRQLIQKPVGPNLPFTHGMTDNSHCVNLNAMKRQLNLNILASKLENSAASREIQAASQSPYAALYNQRYGCVPFMPMGYYPGAMYSGMNNLYPGYLPVGGNMYGAGPAAYPQYSHFQVPETAPGSSRQEHLIPLHPTADSASEAEYLPILLSDSEFTDGGHRSYDEAQLLSAQRLVQEQALQRALAEKAQSRPTVQPQLGPKFHFSREVTSPVFAASKPAGSPSPKPPVTNKKSVPHHVEAPPPSPVDSDASEEFIEQSTPAKAMSKQSLKSEALLADGHTRPVRANGEKSLFQRLKSSLRRAASFSHSFDEAENLELHLRASRLSLRGPGAKALEETETKENLLPNPGRASTSAPTATVSERISR